MIYHVCALYDSKTATYAPPFYVRHIAQAERWLATQVANPDNDLSRFSTDYAIYNLGEFDDTTGVHQLQRDTPILIITARSVKAALAKETL